MSAAVGLLWAMPSFAAAQTETLGPSLPTNTGAGTACQPAAGTTCAWVNTSLPTGDLVQASSDGTITQWSVEAFSGSARLLIVQAGTGGTFTVVGESAVETEPCIPSNGLCLGDFNHANTFSTDLPIAAGQYIGLELISPANCNFDVTPATCSNIGIVPGTSSFSPKSSYFEPAPAESVQTTPKDNSYEAVTYNATEETGPPHTLSVLVNGAGGTVTSSPGGIDCGSTCSAQFPSGTPVTLTANPASGYVFAGWSGGGCSGTATTCTVTMGSDQTVYANFIGYIPSTQGGTTSTQGPGGTSSSPPPKAGSSVNVICNYQFQSGLEVCGATVGGGAAGPPTGSVSFGTGTAGGFPSGSQCTLSRTPNSDTSSCTVSFKPASNNLTKITSLVMNAGYSGDSNYQGATGQSGTRVTLAGSGQLQTTTTIDINTTLTDGGLNFPFDNPIQNGIFKGSLADESGSLATGGAVNVNLARRLKGKLIIASLKRKLGQAGTYNLRIKLTPQGRKQLKLLKKHHKTTLKVILTITDKRAKKHKHAPNAAALINTLL